MNYDKFIEDLYEIESKLSMPQLEVKGVFELKHDLCTIFEEYLKSYVKSSLSGNDGIAIDSNKNWVELSWFTSQEIYDEPEEIDLEKMFDKEDVQDIRNIEPKVWKYLDYDDGYMIYQDEYGRFYGLKIVNDEKIYKITLTFSNKWLTYDLDNNDYEDFFSFMKALYEKLQKIPDDVHIDALWDFDKKAFMDEKTEDGIELGLEHKFVPQKERLKFEAKRVNRKTF